MTRLYLAALSVVVFAAMLVAGVFYAGERIEAHHVAGSDTPGWVAWALCLLWSFAWLGVAGWLGPVTAAPATVAWILPSPVPRGRVLRGGALWACTAGGVVGLVNGALLVYARAPDVPAAVGMLSAGVAGGVFAAAMLIVVQTHLESRWRFTVVPAAVSGVVVSPLVVGVLAAVTVVFALSRLDRMRIRRVAAGSAYAQIVVAGFVTVDPGLAARAAEQLRAGVGGRLVGVGWKAVVSQDLLTLRRSPERLLTAAGLAAMPVLVGRMFGAGALTGVTWVLCGLFAVGLATVNVRRDHDLPALPRLLGLAPRRLLAARAVVPALLGVVWGLCSMAPLGFEAGLLGVVAGPALAAGAMRAARRGRVRHEFPPIVTPVGYVPTGLLYWLVTGLDLGVLLTAPALLAMLGLVSTLLAAGLQFVVLGIFCVASVRKVS